LDISKYIKELVIKNECIILSGFGGFETHYKPACIDNATGSIVPPSKQIVFRQDYTRDNGVLVRFVAEKEGIGQDKAKEIIDDFIGDIVYRLDLEGTYMLEGLGRFIKQPDGSTIFRPSEKENFLIDSFGLSEISIPDKEKPDESPVIEEQPPQKTGAKHTSRILYLVVLIGLLISVAIILAFKTNLFGKAERLITRSENRNDKTRQKIVFGHKKLPDYGDSMANNLSNRIDERTAKEKALLYTEQKPEKVIKTGIAKDIHSGVEKKYFIVAGSFQTEKNAVDFSEQLKYKGFKCMIIRTDNGLYRVVLDTYEEINQAIDGLESYKKQLNNDIWILRI
jgi:nucleoid DNA-binding protein